MPQLLRIGPYILYFWSNENLPLEPVHVHITEGTASANATKIWITRHGHCLLCHNHSRIPERVLNNIMLVIESRSEEVIQKWQDYFHETTYYC